MELRTAALLYVPLCALAGALIGWIGSNAVNGTTAFGIAEVQDIAAVLKRRLMRR